jgi:Fe-S cluster assembly protein SufD
MKNEAWKYTSLVPLHEKGRTVGLGPVDVSAPQGVLVFRLSELGERIQAGAVPEEARARIESLLRPGDVDAVSFERTYFEKLSMSLVVDPFVVWIPEGLVSETPVEISWKSLPAQQWALGAAAIVVGANANVAVLERYGNGVDAQSIATFIDVAPKASVSHLRVSGADGGDGGQVVLASTRAKVAAQARYETAQVSYGSVLSREDLTVELVEADASTVTDGVFIGRGRDVLDHHTNLVHRVGNTQSAQIYKGVLSDESRGVFNGRIAIAKHASGSNSSQMNRNLLLSKKVEIDTKPQLEIDNDDVKAAHGAAIGRLEADHVFYLRSRGIRLGQAVEILSRGFALEAVARLSSRVLRDLGARAIEQGLRGLKWEAM